MTRGISILLAVFVLTFTGSAALASTSGHWSDNEPNFPRGYAYTHDQTPAAWPVYTAAISWDQAPKLDLVYRAASTACAGSRCVPFIATPIGAAGCPASDTTGLTGRNFNGVHITSAISYVDSACASRTYNNRLELVCREMGHAIGLDDRGAGAVSCMRSNVDLGNQIDGSAADFNDLDVAYSHDS
jgi:hypothetical protein